jgi:hypothetical protein
MSCQTNPSIRKKGRRGSNISGVSSSSDNGSGPPLASHNFVLMHDESHALRPFVHPKLIKLPRFNLQHTLQARNAHSSESRPPVLELAAVQKQSDLKDPSAASDRQQSVII